MENNKIYCNLKSALNKKKLLLSDLKGKAASNKEEITLLENEIEEDLNALSMIFNYLISNQCTKKLQEIV